MASLIEQVYHEIVQAIKNDDIVLPTLPEVALRVREAAQDPDVNINNLADIIATDAALTARIIKVVNSPLLRTNKEISGLNMAVSRLGLSYTANLALGLAMEQMFQATNELVDQQLREVWARSVEVAGISHALCRHFTRLKPDQATLAGLTHQIGVLPILTYAEEYDARLLENAAVLQLIIDRLHPLLGKKILQTWDFPATLIDVPREYLDFERVSEQVDYIDIVQVAVLQSHSGTEHTLAEVDWSTVDAFNKLGIDVREKLEEDDEDLNASMEAAMQMLQA